MELVVGDGKGSCSSLRLISDKSFDINELIACEFGSVIDVVGRS